MTFGSGLDMVSLAPSPAFLTKNEREDFRLQPVVVPAWKLRQGHHGLCPVFALCHYLDETPGASERSLLVWPYSLRPCSVAHIASILATVIRKADPGSAKSLQLYPFCGPIDGRESGMKVVDG